VLRSALLVIGACLTAAALLAAALGHASLAWHLALPGVVLLAAILIERRHRYKPIETRPPGPDWTETPERFIDPESGKEVTVYFQPSSGERRYVSR
jgi:hypothetical protein